MLLGLLTSSILSVGWGTHEDRHSSAFMPPVDSLPPFPLGPTAPVKRDAPDTHTHTHADQQHEARYVSASHQATRMSVTWTVYTLKNLRRSYTY